MQIALIPIVPILLFPFILVFFVVIFPLWALALGVLGLLLVITRLGERALSAIGLATGNRLSTSLHGAFRWVLTFGGLAVRVQDPPDDADGA